MFKFLIFFLLIALSTASIIKDASKTPSVEALPLENDIEQELWGKWGDDVMDFVNLVDLEKVMNVVMQHISDPDVINFVEFLYSDEIKRVAVDFLSIEEFEEAINFLQTKGYNAKSVIDIIKSHLERSAFISIKEPTQFGAGITDLIEDILPTLPIDKFKELLVNKLQTNSEIARLFETVTSEEFKDIAKRMSENPKMLEIKKQLESYGFDFKRLRTLAEKFIGDYFEGML